MLDPVLSSQIGLDFSQVRLTTSGGSCVLVGVCVYVSAYSILCGKTQNIICILHPCLQLFGVVFWLCHIAYCHIVADLRKEHTVLHYEAVLLLSQIGIADLTISVHPKNWCRMSCY